jgi:hypothetical protein
LRGFALFEHGWSLLDEPDDVVEVREVVTFSRLGEQEVFFEDRLRGLVLFDCRWSLLGDLDDVVDVREVVTVLRLDERKLVCDDRLSERVLLDCGWSRLDTHPRTQQGLFDRAKSAPELRREIRVDECELGTRERGVTHREFWRRCHSAHFRRHEHSAVVSAPP